MELRLKERLGRKFDEEIRFFKGWIDGPKSVGAILPTSAVTARRMASVINPASGLPVLELGPGTGIITKAIIDRGVAAENIVSIEYSTDFYQHLKRTIPGVNFINGDAFDLDTTLGDWKDRKFDAVISAIPMLSFPMEKRIALLEDLLDRMPPGRPVVQITYSPVSPIDARPDRFHIRHLDFVVRNIPPAQLWVYSRG
ncbi:Phosphatidylethanolamine N-methyltransferase/phosphatidyl-N-methylethanolamine N-methyltransferase protein [Pseudorhizobium banfieldiae]|uniref:Phosphatidylethanolamine N-methyltransferase/phosphatidyl-N-methylethanolamine N-methyltransferase protein n=1 Tax=Pseudorhizobium banfieldiae TaxID=1125847 RepID=L0NLL3_9HYPH|nr:class I SAM-dependent methyltransferase [Pseudorhizobium banfieldiae]CAD6596829.1 methyltransferase domain-containing protein [arsenite-oxidising bacterium NT-25]CAD6603173.1 methyltransferase domain-containing protein [Rhizobium sp. TCK]CAD6616587.1 methyltransferase domain-containing protein [Rhizobium sp. Khangiran2]CCF22003.1 Phosphatidylethanolamine N-methyltransferase/phosphatidyl-N-methylethanolamine N-methyltransferase protein [Pseudorhizobium banfieldiae]